MSFKFAVGDKVTQAFSNHAEGTIIAILKDRGGEYRYVIEMDGHRTIQIAGEGSLVAAPRSYAARSSICLLAAANASLMATRACSCRVSLVAVLETTMFSWGGRVNQMWT